MFQKTKALKRNLTVAVLVVSGVLFCHLLLLPGDPMSQRVGGTYADLLRGPLVLGQEDPVLIKYVRGLMDGPSSEPYNLRYPDREDNSQNGQQAYLLDIIGNRRGGTFLEAGAYDGEIHSNTIFLERTLNWTGVLVEAEDENYEALLTKHRRSQSLNACLAPTAYPKQIAFEHMPGQVTSYLLPDFYQDDLDSIMRLKQCFPLYSVLAAAGLTSLDFLSLDVEGIDHLVLKSLPWKKIDIKIVMVEYVTPAVIFPNGSYNPEFEKPIKDIMFDNDYILAHQLPTDLIFVKNGSVYDSRH